MRTKLALAGLGLGLAGAMLPTTSASASCILLPTGACVSACNTAAGVLRYVVQTTGAPVGPVYCTQ